MYEYQHGGNAVFESDGQSILDLSANINPLGLPKGATEAIKDQIPFTACYPDSLSRELRNAIATWEQVKPEWLFCGNGASDIIFRLPVCLKPKTALLPVPTFSDYERSLKSFDVHIMHHDLPEEKGFHLDESIIQTIRRNNIDMIFICNPNNPTGVLTERSVIEKILSCCVKTNTLVVVDECFIDFVEESDRYTVKPLLKKYANLIILKAFTKIFAMPGIRLGYGISSNSRIIGKLYESGPDWAVSNLAQAAGIAAVNAAAHSAYISETVSFVTKERACIKKELEKMNYITFDSKANYIFFKNPHHFNLYEKLKEFKMRIRNCGNYTGLSENYCRVAVSTIENNQKFKEAMKAIWICTKS